MALVRAEIDYSFDWDGLKKLVRETLSKDTSGHDYSHILRVLNNCYMLAENILDVDYDVLVAACLLHDIYFDTQSPKTHHITSAEKALPILKKFGFNNIQSKKILHAIINHNRGFGKDGIDLADKLSVEAKILCDADRIDALGSIGITRMVAYSLTQNIPYFRSKNDARDESIYGNFKYMITLADDMLTESGKKLAKERVRIMNDFIDELVNESDV